MQYKALAIVAAILVVALVGATTVSIPLQDAYAGDRNNGCRYANCQGVNGNQNSANGNSGAFNFGIG